MFHLYYSHRATFHHTFILAWWRTVTSSSRFIKPSSDVMYVFSNTVVIKGMFTQPKNKNSYIKTRMHPDLPPVHTWCHISSIFQYISPLFYFCYAPVYAQYNSKAEQRSFWIKWKTVFKTFMRDQKSTQAWLVHNVSVKRAVTAVPFRLGSGRWTVRRGGSANYHTTKSLPLRIVLKVIGVLSSFLHF